MNICEKLRSTSPRYDHLTGELRFNVFNNRDGEDAADVIDALVSAGKKLANCAFNIAQRGEISERELAFLREAQEEWDAALAKASQ